MKTDYTEKILRNYFEYIFRAIRSLIRVFRVPCFVRRLTDWLFQHRGSLSNRKYLLRPNRAGEIVVNAEVADLFDLILNAAAGKCRR
jgi:hypothetical protein